MKDADAREAPVHVDNFDEKSANADEEKRRLWLGKDNVDACQAGVLFMGLPGEIPPPFGLKSLDILFFVTPLCSRNS